MEEPGSGETVLITIMDEEEQQQKEKEEQQRKEKEERQTKEKEEQQTKEKEEQQTKEEELQNEAQRAVTELLSDLDLIKNLKHPDEHSSDWQQVGRGDSTSGFYKVPEDMRRRAGSEAAALYDPKHVNFRKIKELFEKDYQGDVQTRNQLLRHYDYHLRSYVNRWDGEDDIEGSMRRLCQDFQFTVAVDENVSEPCSHGHLLGSPVLWANIFLDDLFYRSFQGEFSPTDDPECAHLWASELWADLLLLENQIPVLNRDDLILLLVICYFEDFIPLRKRNWRQNYNNYHILDLIHELLLPMTSRSISGSHPLAWLLSRTKAAARSMMRPVSRWLRTNGAPSIILKLKSVLHRLLGPIIHWSWSQKETTPSTMKPVPTTTRLQQAGIKFEPVDKAGFVVVFKRGVLKLPRLHITKCTKKVIMNLIAWEMCHHEAAKYFINFAIFMDHLINTSKDVDILIQSGVIEHSLATDEEVAALFNGLSEGLVYTKNQPPNEEYNIFPKLSFDIRKYCKSRSNVWLANLMQDYFKSPWTIISVVAALFLILLTVLQTFFSAYSYFRPPK